MTGCKYEIRFGAVTADLGRSLGESGRLRGELWQNTGPATTRGSVVWWNHSQHMGQGVGQGAGEEERRRGGEEERRRGRHFKAKSVFIHIHGLRVLQKYEESGKKIMVSGDALRDPAPLACVRDEWQRVRGESRRVCAVLHACSVHLKIAGLVLGMIACWLFAVRPMQFCGMQAAFSFTWRCIVGNGG
jgi:hypothetical protein